METPNTTIETANATLETPNTTIETPNTKMETPNLTILAVIGKTGAGKSSLCN
jgi:predicted GTPase